VNISGGTVLAPSGIAVFNLGIDPNNTVNISGGTISTITGTALYNSDGIVNISGGTVSAPTGTAVLNGGTYGYSTVNISGGTISTTTGTALYNSDGIVNISGGTVSSSSFAYRGGGGDGSMFPILTLSGSPDFIGKIWLPADGTLRVAAGFNPGTNLYTLYFDDSYVAFGVDMIVVTSGADYIANFKLDDQLSDYTLYTSGQNIMVLVP